MNTDTISFTENTNVLLDGQTLMFSNIMLQDYKQDNGEMTEGLAASLALPNGEDWLTLGKGSHFTLGDKTYVIVDIIDGEEREDLGEILVQSVQ